MPRGSQPSVTPPTRKQSIIWAGLLLVLASVLRLFLLGTHSLWLDESYSLDMAASGLEQILENTGKDAHPPLYYLLLHFWLSRGRSEVMLRLPSVVLGSLSIPLAYALARLWCSHRVALLAALFLALSPLLVWYSQEARMYSLLAFLGLSSTLFLSLVLKRGHLIWWLPYFVSALAGLYTHYGMLLLLLGQDLWLAVWWATRERRTGLVIPWLSSQAALALSFLPWLPVLLNNLGGQAGLQWFVLLRLESLGTTGLLLSLTGSLAVLLVLATVALALRPGSTDPAIQPRDVWLKLAGLVLYPLLTMASAFPQGTSIKRQLVLFLPYLLILSAAGLGKVGRARNLAVFSLVFLTCLSLTTSYMQREREDWRGVASLVEAVGQPGDIVLFHAGYVQAPFDYYYQGTLPRADVKLQDLDSQLADVQAHYGRAWVVLSHDAFEDPQGLLRRWLGERWALQSEWLFAGVEVRLYDVRVPGPPSGYYDTGDIRGRL